MYRDFTHVIFEDALLRKRKSIKFSHRIRGLPVSHEKKQKPFFSLKYKNYDSGGFILLMIGINKPGGVVFYGYAFTKKELVFFDRN